MKRLSYAPTFLFVSYSWRVLRVQKNHEVEKSQICTQDSASPTKSSQNTSWWEDIDDGSDNDLDLKELSRALSEAGTLASNSKKPRANQHTKNFASASSNQRECVADNDTPGKISHCVINWPLLQSFI